MEILDRIQPVTLFELFQIFIVCPFGLLRIGQAGLLYAAPQRLLHPVHLRQIQSLGICDRVSVVVHKRTRDLLIDLACIALRSRRIFGVIRSGNNRYRRTIF